MNILRRIAPAVLLFFLSPLIGEWLLGDLTLGQIGAIIALAPLYGGGAILIREVLRRTDRGWPSFVFLALAYALLEEGLATQSLFNPNYLHLRLLDYGFIPALGTSLAWTTYVLTIHIVWSLAVPIGLAESLFAGRRNEPWLGRAGLAVVTFLYLAGLALVMSFSIGETDFRASPGQLGGTILLAGICIVAAFAIRARPRPAAPDAAMSPVTVGAACLLLGSLFLMGYAAGPGALHLAWPITLAFLVTMIVATLAFFTAAIRKSDWTLRQIWAAAFGGMLCYAWFGYSIDRSLHGPGGAPEHTIFVLLSVLVGFIGGWRALRGSVRATPIAA